MKIFNSFMIKRKIKEIQPIVDKELIELNLLKVENGKKIYSLGSIQIAEGIRKRILKQKYNIEYKTIYEKHPKWNID